MMEEAMNEDWKSALDRALDAWDKRHIVISPDIDGLISAAILRGRYNGAKVCGFYPTRHLLVCQGYTLEDCKAAIWVDQDIVHPDIVCLGQHLILYDENDKISRRNPKSFNPNVHFGQSYKNSFKGTGIRSGQRDKYPFGTCHFLLHLNDSNQPLSLMEKSLLAHADSSFASTHRYRHNCETWLELMFKDSEFVKFLISDYLEDEKTFDFHEDLVKKLIEAGINKRKNQTSNRTMPGRWQDLTGYQTISYGANHRLSTFTKKITSIANCLRRISRFDIGEIPKIERKYTGDVEKNYPDEIAMLREDKFDQYIEDKGIFSLAFSSQREFRYTKNFF